MNKRLAIYVLVSLMAFSLAVPIGYTFAAWILKGQILGSKVGAKSKYLQLSTDGTTWTQTIPSGISNITLTPGGDTANLLSFQAKTSRPLTNLKWSFENLQWYKHGVLLVTPPTGGVDDEDIRNYLSVSRDGGLTYAPFTTFDTSTEAWLDADANSIYDNTLELRFKLDAGVESVNGTNGQQVSFDIGVEGL